jgi:hypothetical protein
MIYRSILRHVANTTEAVDFHSHCYIYVRVLSKSDESGRHIDISSNDGRTRRKEGAQRNHVQNETNQILFSELYHTSLLVVVSDSLFSRTQTSFYSVSA